MDPWALHNKESLQPTEDFVNHIIIYIIFFFHKSFNINTYISADLDTMYTFVKKDPRIHSVIRLMREMFSILLIAKCCFVPLLQKLLP